MKKSLKKLTAMLTATAMVSCSMVSGVTLAAEIKSASRMLSPISQQGMINADVDFDGQVTAMDVNLIQKSVIGLVKFEVSADSGILPGDVNLDGLVNMMDCVVLKNYLIYGGISDKYYSDAMVKFVPVRSEIAVSPSENSEFDAGYTIYSLNGGISGIKAKIDIDEDFDIYDVYSNGDFMWNEDNNEISMLYDKPINEVELYIGVKPYVDNGSYSLKLTDIEIIDAEGALISDANISAEPVNINFEEPVFMTTTTEPMVTTTTTTEPVDYTTTTTETEPIDETTTTEPVWETTTTETEPLTTTTVTTTEPAYNDKADIIFDFGSHTAEPGHKIVVPVIIDAGINPVAGIDVTFAIDSPLTISRIGGSSPACNDASVTSNVAELSANFTSLSGHNPIVPTAGANVFILQVTVPEGCPDGLYKIGFGDKCAVFKDGTSFNYTTAVVNGDIIVSSASSPVSTTAVVDYTTTTTTTTEPIDYTTTTTTTEPVDYTTTTTTTEPIDYTTTTTTTEPVDYTTTTTTTEPIDYTTTTTTTEPVDYTTTTTTTEPIDYTTTSYSDSTTVSYYPDYTETTADTTAPDYTATETTTTDMLGSTATETTANTTEPDYTATETTTTVPMDTTTTNDINDVSTTTTTSEEPVIPEASATTTTVPSDDLPQTGMPIARAVEGIAVLLTISGTALIVKSRRESDET